jgi:hypothetical protein
MWPTLRPQGRAKRSPLHRRVGPHRAYAFDYSDGLRLMSISSCLTGILYWYLTGTNEVLRLPLAGDLGFHKMAVTTSKKSSKKR